MPRYYRPMTCSTCKRDMHSGDKFDVRTVNGESKSYCQRYDCQAAMRAADGMQSGGRKRPVIA